VCTSGQAVNCSSERRVARIVLLRRIGVNRKFKKPDPYRASLLAGYNRAGSETNDDGK